MRDDLTNNLVHLTKGIGDDSSKHREEALLTFDTIVSERRLLGNTGFIKGGYRCVCFSEAPIGKLSYLIASGADELVLFDLFMFAPGRRQAMFNDYEHKKQ